jgi:hypothetical protein
MINVFVYSKEKSINQLSVSLRRGIDLAHKTQQNIDTSQTNLLAIIEQVITTGTQRNNLW